MAKKPAKKPTNKALRDVLEVHKFSLVSSKFGPVLKTNLDLDDVIIMLDPVNEDDLADFQVINQTTGEVYNAEKHVKLVNTNIENQD